MQKRNNENIKIFTEAKLSSKIVYCTVHPHQVIPSHGNPQMRQTLFDGYFFEYCSIKYQTFHQVSENTSQQTYSHQKTT